MKRSLIFILILMMVCVLGAGGCALTRDGGMNRAEALLEFSQRQPMNDGFNDPVFYDDEDPNAEILNALNEVDEIADRQLEKSESSSNKAQ